MVSASGFAEMDWLIGDDGWIPAARRCCSPNCDARPEGVVVNTLVIHAISLPPDKFGDDYISDLFTNRLNSNDHPYFEEISEFKVSSHLLINRKGVLTQYVPVIDRAWHAGLSVFRGVEQVNDFSIGLELEGCDSQPFEEDQYHALVKLTKAIQRRFPTITMDRIVGHADIAPGRKTDPGPCFDWLRFRKAMTAWR